MPTRLGLYGGPTSAAGGSTLTPATSSHDLNVELRNGSTVSTTKVVDEELRDGSPVSTTKAINIEIIDIAASAGNPDSVLNLPPDAVASRLRADFYEWVNANPSSLVPNSQYIGAKVGTASVLSISDFSYTSRLSGVGDWSITVPLADNHLEPIFDGTAQIIKIYYEGVGHIFTGWISSYNIESEEVVEISGYDLMILLARASSLWRVDLTKVWEGFSSLPGGLLPVLNAPWFFSYLKIVEIWCNSLQIQFSNVSDRPAFDGKNFRFSLPQFQDQSIFEILKDLEEISGNSFRIDPTSNVLTVGLFGDDSGIIISNFQNEDIEIREQGGLAITGISYSKNDDDIVNFLIPQGSNDSFGVAVELRHVFGAEDSINGTRRYVENNRTIDNIQIPYGDPRFWDENPAVEEAIITDDSGFLLDSVPRYAYKPIRRVEPGASRFEARNRIKVDSYIENNARNFYNFVPSRDFYLTFISILNVGGTGSSRFYFSGGEYTQKILFTETNWSTYLQEYASLPGFSPDSLLNILLGNEGSIPSDVIERLSDNWDLHRGRVEEVLAFMNLPRGPGDDTPPWPLCKKNTTYTIEVDNSRFVIGHPIDIIYVAPEEERATIPGQPSALFLFAPSLVAPRYAEYIAEPRIMMEVSGHPVDSVYPYPIEGMFASRAGGDNSDSGHRVFFIRDLESIKKYGLRQKTVSFHTALDSLTGTKAIRPMSDLLYDLATTYLIRNKDPRENISVTTTGAFRIPFVGQKARVVYRGVTKTETGDFKWADIDGLYYVTGISWSITEEGIAHKFELSNVPENIVSDPLAQKIIKNVNRTNNYLSEFQTSLNHIGKQLPRLLPGA